MRQPCTPGTLAGSGSVNLGLAVVEANEYWTA